MPMLEDMKALMEAAYYGTSFDGVKKRARADDVPKSAPVVAASRKAKAKS
jgi:hypothetical protein